MIKADYKNLGDSFALIPDGYYQAMVNKAIELSDDKLTLEIKIRNDVEQACKGRTLRLFVVASSERDSDKKKIQQLASVAGIAEGEEFDLPTLYIQLDKLPIRIRVGHYTTAAGVDRNSINWIGKSEKD